MRCIGTDDNVLGGTRLDFLSFLSNGKGKLLSSSFKNTMILLIVIISGAQDYIWASDQELQLCFQTADPYLDHMPQTSGYSDLSGDFFTEWQPVKLLLS